MPQFGTGPQLAAQCPQVPIPDGWRSWTDADGDQPNALKARAAALQADQGVALGTTESFPIPGTVTLIRVEPHAWNRDAQGNLVEGCFRASGVYLPSGTAAGAGVTPPTDNVGRTVGILTAVSLAVGTAATLATWKASKK